MDKGTRVDQIDDATRRLHAAGISVGFFLQFGYQKVESRVKRLGLFDEGSDRDNTVLGRRSRRFYEYAQQWIVRIGMRATQHEIETG